MKEYLRELILRHRSPGVIVDTNLLLLLLVGDLSPERVEHFRPTRSRFEAADYVRLKEVLTALDRLVVTPHILTEVSNFLTKAPDEEAAAVRNLIGTNLSRFDIKDIPLSTLVSSPTYLKEFCKFGLTDAVIIHLARQGYLTVTIDVALAQYIISIDKQAFNYTNATCNNIMEAKWGR